MNEAEYYVHVLYFGRGYAKYAGKVNSRTGEELYQIRHESLPMVVYRVPSQFEVLEVLGFHRALVDGVQTADPREAETLMRQHMAKRLAATAKAQYSAESTRRALLARDLTRLDMDTLIGRYSDLAPVSPLNVRVAWWRTVRRMMQRLNVPALPAPRARILMLPQPQVGEAEERKAA